ncbi:Golgi apparatus membrane protein TVP23 A [Physocladia obscura]|uniref:Golgi apparatus membrane protein TVP23 n=1 Tax=Physocladia obscura TaxID=109957 RepID=A0AAD5T3V8_9FUNG|nr:Golgi apparatus membrane protein TVP23 A [Physocladia obscura]
MSANEPLLFEAVPMGVRVNLDEQQISGGVLPSASGIVSGSISSQQQQQQSQQQQLPDSIFQKSSHPTFRFLDRQERDRAFARGVAMTRTINPTDSSVFWFALYAAPAVWFVFGLGAILRFSFQWTICVVVALVLNMANVIGYTRCHKDAQSRVNNFIQNRGLMQSVVTTIVGNTIGNFFGGGSSAAAPATRV